MRLAVLCFLASAVLPSVDGLEIGVAKDPACPDVEGDGTFRGLCGDVSSGPSDNWISPDGGFL